LPPGLTNIVAIGGGYGHNLALNSDGVVASWGWNDAGQTNVPSTLANVVAIAAGGNHNLALIGDGPPALHALLSNPTWGTNGFSVSARTQSGRVYRLEYKNSLSDSNWTALPLVAGNGGITTLTDSSATGAQRYYRVRQW
jgi:hypothetical protein